MNPKVQDLINQIKERAAGLEYTEDGLAFDKRVGELDLLLYELRTVAWHDPRPLAAGIPFKELPEGVKAHRIGQWINELTKELGYE